MAGNRRISRTGQWGLRALAALWQVRFVLALAIPYLVLFGWLFAGGEGIGIHPADALEPQRNPVWESPDSEHWFGTTGDGTDLFALSRLAMARSVALAVVIGALGSGFALLLVMLFALDPGEGRFHLLDAMGAGGFLFPPVAGLVIVAGGTDGSLPAVALAFVVVIGFALAPVVAGWFREGERGNHVLAGYALGLARTEMVRYRILPDAARRLLGVFTRLVPTITLAEMALSFLGLMGERFSCGALVAHGRQLILEAPWVAIGPGIMATGVVALLALLGWLVAASSRTGPLPKLF